MAALSLLFQVIFHSSCLVMDSWSSLVAQLRLKLPGSLFRMLIWIWVMWGGVGGSQGGHCAGPQATCTLRVSGFLHTGYRKDTPIALGIIPQGYGTWPAWDG